VSPLSVETQVHPKEHWLKQFLKQIFLLKSLKQPKKGPLSGSEMSSDAGIV
jgi:hypothetical protein